MSFIEKLQAKWDEGKFVCVGLDTDQGRLPRFWDASFKDKSSIQFLFNREIIGATHDLVCSYKPNSSFYEALGADGIESLMRSCRHIKEVAPEVPVILDVKRADIGNTNQGYAKFAFDICGADAITVHPYLGMEAMEPFLERADKGVIVLCRTSNPGAGEFQDLPLNIPEEAIPYSLRNMYPPGPVVSVNLHEWVAMRVAHSWNYNGNCGLVVGATYPQELARVRRIVDDMPILIPGIGAQGGDLEATVTAGQNSQGQGFIINSSRGVIFASDGPDFAEAARAETQKLSQQIKTFTTSQPGVSAWVDN